MSPPSSEKRFCAGIFRGEIELESFGGSEMPQKALALLGAEAIQNATFLKAILQPQTLCRIRDVREFGADRCRNRCGAAARCMSRSFMRFGIASVRLPV